MSDLNNVNLIGRLTRDSELKYTNSGIAVSRLSIAVNKTKMSNGQKTEEVSFFNVVVWNKIAEALNQYLLKGKQIAISGELVQKKWEDQQGNKKNAVEINAHTIQLLGGDKQNNQQRPPQQPQAQQFQEPQMESSKPQNVSNDDFQDDLIPF